MDGRGGLTIGTNASISTYSKIITSSHNLQSDRREFISKPVEIGDNVFIGTGAIILPGCTLGNRCVLGAGAVATRGGITPTVFGGFYINFGTAGIFICSFLLGIWFRKLDNWIYSGNVDFWRAYTLILVPSCLGGGIANIMIQPRIFGIYYLFLSVISYPHHATISTNVNREFHSKGKKTWAIKVEKSV